MSDPLYFTTPVLLPFNGANGSTAFLNYAGPGSSSLVPTGNVNISTAQSKFGGSSLLLDGAGDYLALTPLVTVPSSADFTVEGWFYAVAFPAAGATAQLISYFGSTGLCFVGNAAVWMDSSSPQITSAALPPQTWHHLAVARLDGVITLYVNGVAVATKRAYSPAVSVYHIGGYPGNFNGYIDDVRVTVFAARYSANFTPPGAHDLEPPPLVPSIQGAYLPLIKLGPPPLTPHRMGDIKLLKDLLHGGSGRITGTVKEVGTPDHAVRRRVRLHRMIDGLLIREVWSDAVTGAYAFNNIDPTYKFYVVSHDHILNYNAIIKDNIIPESMP